jgi:hypothetical protein
MSSIDEAISSLIDQKVAVAVAAALADLPTRREPRELLTTKELEVELHLSRSTIDRLRLRGLPHVFVGDSPRYNVKTVKAWLEENTQPRTGRGANGRKPA